MITSDRHKTLKAAKIAAVLAASLLILYNVFPPIRELVTRTVQLNAGGDEFTRTSGRSGMWKVAMNIFLSHKLLGQDLQHLLFIRVAFIDLSYGRENILPIIYTMVSSQRLDWLEH